MIALVAALVPMGPIQLAAQQRGTIAAGTKVRVSAPSITPSPLVGTVSSVTADSMRLLIEGNEGETALPLAALQRLEVARLKRGSNASVAVGTVVGLGVGIFEAIKISSEECDDEGWFGGLCDLQDFAVVGLPLTGAALGAAAGYLVGLLFKTERWQDAPIPRPDFALGVGSHGNISLTLSATLRI